jgi:hypothetical protein
MALIGRCWLNFVFESLDQGPAAAADLIEATGAAMNYTK